MACRFPGGATSPERFWVLVQEGIDAITEVPSERSGARAAVDRAVGGTGFPSCGGFVDRVEDFDAEFFGISPREACRVDPQHRLLLEVAWEALENGGQPPDGLAGAAVGVFVGIASHDYGDFGMRLPDSRLIDAYVNAGSALSIAANRISYHLDLRGPSLAVDTACSSGLTAVHLACQSLARAECELAVAGGVNVVLAGEPTIGFWKAGMLAPDGRCKPFDAKADGYGRSEGAAAIVLKPLTRALEDGDPIRAIIRGTAVNQDGRTTGISVPSEAAHEELLRRALASAGLAPEQIQYVEAHGTGTPVGDPIEARAIGRVYGARRPAARRLPIGSVKGNIGHTEAASGLAGLIKTALALERGHIPPTVHFANPNPSIPFDELRLRVPSSGEAWPAAPGPRIAGVNSFGFGGANAHVILEAAPVQTASAALPDGEHDHIATLSARSPAALSALARSWISWLSETGAGSLRDVCYTAALRRAHHRHRLAAVASSREELVLQLEAHLAGEQPPALVTGTVGAQPPKLAFVFSGMGPQWAGMGRELMHDEPVFRTSLEECDRLLQGIAGWSLMDALAADGATSPLAETSVAQVANLAIQVGLAALWRSWGIVPDAVAGHSVGEIAAAHVAGALSLPDALRIVVHRGRLLQRIAGQGGMLAVGLSAEAAARLLDGDEGRICIAALNAPTAVTLSGELSALAEIASRLDQDGVFCRPLAVDVPYHGPQLDGLRGEFLAALEGLRCSPPTIPIVSTVTGTSADDQPFDSEYWWRNLRRQVRFADAVAQLGEDGCSLFLELGPHPVLAGAVAECLAACGRHGTTLASLRRGEDERRSMLRSLSSLHVLGRAIDWASVVGRGGQCIPLPSYPWQRDRHWFEPTAGEIEAPGVDSGHPLLGRRLRATRPTWEVALADARLDYLEEHEVQEVPTFPAAAYVEMAIAASHALQPSGPLALEHVEFRRLLAMAARDGQLLQSVAAERGAAIEIYGTRRGADSNWTLHALAWLRAGAAESALPEPVDVDAIRERCAEPVPLERFYLQGEARGLRYGPAFRGIAELRSGRGEALGWIEAPSVLAGIGDHHVHPALLDASLQVLMAALDTADAPQGAIVPVAIRRVELRHPPGSAFWVHAELANRDGAHLEGNVRLLDAAGNVRLACEGVRLRALEQRRRTLGEDWLYCEEWEEVVRRRPRRATELPTQAELADAARRSVERLSADDYYVAIEPALNALTGQYVLAARHDGEQHIAPERRRHWRRLAETPCDRGTIAPEELSKALLAAYPDYAPIIELVRQSGERLPGTLRNQEDAARWLFAGELWEVLASLYADPPPFRVLCEAIADVVAAARRYSPERQLRILEVGAGTGATTAAVLERLDGEPVEYDFTDISPFMLRRARHRFGDRPGLRFDTLDIEQVPAGGEPPYDVVIAANVVHATADVRATLRNLRRLLAPDGLLVLQEGIRRSPWVDLLFGQLEGWWRASDLDLRPAHPLLGLEDWPHVLEQAGLGDVECVTDGAANGGEPAMALFLARASAAVADEARGRRWLILADKRGVAQTIAAALRTSGDECSLLYQGEPRTEDAASVYEHVGAYTGLIHLWSLDAPTPEHLTTSALMGAQSLGCGSLPALARALATVDVSLPEVWLITAGAQRAGEDTADLQPAQAPLWGAGRTLRNERPGLRCRLVDLGTHLQADVEALVAELIGADGRSGEDELLIRGGKLLGRRLRRAPLAAPVPVRFNDRSAQTDSFRLETDSPGTLESLVLRETPARAPGPGEVEIKVEAAGLNFKDVLVALGMLARTTGSPTLGFECAGVVTACGAGVEELQAGDEVIAIASGSFASRVVTRAELVARRPQGLSVEEAATIPGPFGTALRALGQLAQLAPGERVLIHSAAGGVGLAAVQLAQRTGAEIFATAGTPEKRAYLEGLGVRHVLESRSLAWVDEVLARTDGEGVDVVLNSLAGEALVRGVQLLRPYGRFVEIGKRDLQRNAPLGLGPFERSLSFFSLQLDLLVDERPSEAGALLRQVVHDFEEGVLEPLPQAVFDLAEAEHAFRYMAQARHIGRIVLGVDRQSYRVAERPEAGVFRSDATYLIVGGLGGLGLRLAAYMVRRGARGLVLAGRSGKPQPEVERTLDNLRMSGASVLVAPCDVTDEAALGRLLTRIRATMPPLRGVVHAAAVLADGLLEGQSEEAFRAVLAPKVAGAWNLHELTLEDELDLFVLFSSFSSVLGPPGQASYAAANAFLDALAHYRRARGLPALALNFGSLADAGLVVRHPQVRDYLGRIGLVEMPTDDAFAIVEQLIRHGIERRMVAQIDWRAWADGPAAALRATVLAPFGTLAESAGGADAQVSAENLRLRVLDSEPDARVALVERYLVRKLASILDQAPERIGPDVPLVQMGLDSLMAVELMSALQQDLGASVALSDLLDQASLRDLGGAALGQLTEVVSA